MGPSFHAFLKIMFIDIGFEKKMFNEYFMNLISSQPKVLFIYQFLIFIFGLKFITLLFIFNELWLAYTNLHLLQYDSDIGGGGVGGSIGECGVGRHLVLDADSGLEKIYLIDISAFLLLLFLYISKGKIKHSFSDFLKCKMILNDYTFTEYHKWTISN